MLAYFVKNKLFTVTSYQIKIEMSSKRSENAMFGGDYLTAQTKANKSDAKAVRNAYAREWRKNNPDKVKAANARYWEKKAAEMKTVEEVATAAETK